MPKTIDQWEYHYHSQFTVYEPESN